MPPVTNFFNSSSRARAKQASRIADQNALASGRATVVQMKRDNEAFAAFAPSARIDLSASRRLA